MDKIIAAIAAHENEDMWKGHFGDAPVFLKFSIYRCGKCEPAGKLINTKKDEDEKHGSEIKMRSIKEMLDECCCVAARAMSPNFKKLAENTEIQPVVIKNAENAAEALEKIIIHYQMLDEMIKKRRSGERDAAIPEL